MAAAVFMISCGVKDVKVLKGKWQDDKEWKKSDKDLDAEKKPTAKGATFTKADNLFAEYKDLKGASVVVVDMRDKKEKAFAKDVKSLNVAMFWEDKKQDAVAVGTVLKTIADVKITPEDKLVIAGGANDALAMMVLLKAEGFKHV